jgi:shikimate dehydrogenase
MDSIKVSVGSKTKYILSTSGRLSSLKRYKSLLNDILALDIIYLPLTSHDSTGKVDPQRFSFALRGIPCIGGAISKDIKSTIIPYLDDIEENAKSIGSVNTVLVKDGCLKGYNTDALGFEYAISQGLKDSGVSVRKAVCYGYGGVAAVVTTVLKSFGLEVYLTGRNEVTLRSRAEELHVQAWSGEQCDLFVNASPASERPLEEAANFLPALKGCSIAFDHEMPGACLAEYCLINGVYLIKGTAMYYPQMVAQWSLFLEGVVPTIREQLPSLIKLAEERALASDDGAV